MECYYISTMREIHLTDDMQNENNDISQIGKRESGSIKTDTCINIGTCTKRDDRYLGCNKQIGKISESQFGKGYLLKRQPANCG